MLDNSTEFSLEEREGNVRVWSRYNWLWTCSMANFCENNKK
jgi:hypothetical protein